MTARRPSGVTWRGVSPVTGCEAKDRSCRSLVLGKHRQVDTAQDHGRKEGFERLAPEGEGVHDAVFFRVGDEDQARLRLVAFGLHPVDLQNPSSMALARGAHIPVGQMLGLVDDEEFAGIGRVAADLDLPAFLLVLDQGVGEPRARAG